MSRSRAKKKSAKRGRGSIPRQRRSLDAEQTHGPDQSASRDHRDTGSRTLPFGICLELVGTDTDKHQLAVQYWTLADEEAWAEPASLIAQRAGVSISKVGVLIRPHAVARSVRAACPRCGTIPVVTNRTDHDARIAEARSGRHCEDCRQAIIVERDRIAQSLVERWCKLAPGYQADAPPSIPDLVYNEPLYALALLALMRRSTEVDGVLRPESWLPPREGCGSLLGTYADDDQLLAELVHAGYLLPVASTPPSAFSWDDACEISGWQPTKIHYRTPWTLAESTATVAINLREELANGIWSSDAIMQTWLRILGCDAMAYLDRTMRYFYHFPHIPRAKLCELEEVMTDVVAHTPLGQIYSAAYAAARNATAWYREKFQAHGSGRDLERASTAAASNLVAFLGKDVPWQRPTYQRKSTLLPWSAVAKLFFQIVVDESLDPHTTVPAIEHISLGLSVKYET